MIIHRLFRHVLIWGKGGGHQDYTEIIRQKSKHTHTMVIRLPVLYHPFFILQNENIIIALFWDLNQKYMQLISVFSKFLLPPPHTLFLTDYETVVYTEICGYSQWCCMTCCKKENHHNNRGVNTGECMFITSSEQLSLASLTCNKSFKATALRSSGVCTPHSQTFLYICTI